jgi:Cu/Zn superoxide dismutase
MRRGRERKWETTTDRNKLQNGLKGLHLMKRVQGKEGKGFGILLAGEIFNSAKRTHHGFLNQNFARGSIKVIESF